jgi:hypothetical protein
MDCGRLHDFPLQAFTLQPPQNRCSSDTGLNRWRNRSQKSEMMVFLPLLPPHRLYVTTFSKIYAGLSPKDDERKIQKKNTVVHAYNMLQGHQCLTPERLQRHTRDVLQQDCMYLHTVHLEPTDLCTLQGDFSLHCLNHYCITRKNRAFIGKRIIFFTPLQAIYDALCYHGTKAFC